MGTIVERRKMWGMMPSSKDLRHSKQRGKASSSLHSFRIIAANLSGPTAEYLSTSSMAFIISSGQKDMSSRQKLKREALG